MPECPWCKCEHENGQITKKSIHAEKIDQLEKEIQEKLENLDRPAPDPDPEPVNDNPGDLSHQKEQNWLDNYV